MIYIETDLGYIMVSLTEEHNMTDQRYTLDRIRSHAEYTRTNCDTLYALIAGRDCSLQIGKIERLLCDIKCDMQMIDKHVKDIP